MALDDLVLGLQRALDRLVRRLRLGPPPVPGQRRLLIVQIDGLSRAVLEEAMAQGRAPFLARLLHRRGYLMAPMCVGLPTSTPAFQLAAMYGVRPDIPGFHYHDRRRKSDVYFPRAGDAARVEQTQAAGRRGILDGGGAYGCIFTGGGGGDPLSVAGGPRPPRAPRAGGRVAGGFPRLWRVLRRVPEHGYDFYVLSDHGQAACVPYRELTDGPPIEQSLFDDFLDPPGATRTAVAGSR